MLILALILSSQLFASQVPTHSDQTGTLSMPYEDRLINILEMAEVSPGFSEMVYRNRQLGALGGLYVQTEWQLKTGRDQIPAWRYFNFHLVVEPHTFFNDYIKYGPKSCDRIKTNTIGINRKRVCETWVAYFRYSDNRFHTEPTLAKKVRSNELLWKAHDMAIDYALMINPNVFKNMKTPTLERDYLRGWFKFVHILAKTKMPTSEFFIRLLAKPSSPQCAPLGAPHCTLSDLPPTSQIFVREMVKMGRRP